MRTICLLAQKGGSGKTTLARNLAVAATEAGKRVVLMDTDPQQSLRQWWDAREAEDPKLLVVGPDDDLASAVAGMSRLFDLAIIDTPPAASSSLAPVLEASDMAVIPVRASGDDLRAIGPTLALLKAADKPFCFVLSQVTPRAKMTGLALVTLAQHGRVAPTQIPTRIVYAEASITGQGATEASDPRAAEETRELYTYLEGIIP